MNNIARKTNQNMEYVSYSEDTSNLTVKDQNILKSIIHKDTSFKTSTTNKKMLTLEELAKIVSHQYER